MKFYFLNVGMGGTYGCTAYCLVQAGSEEEAEAKMKAKWPDGQQEQVFRESNEVVFDENGVSQVLCEGW